MRLQRLVAGLALYFAACGVHADIIALDQAALQHQINKLFPVAQELPSLAMRLHRPVVRLSSASDRVQLKLSIEAQAAGLAPYAGDLAVSGKPRYVRSERAIYVDDPVVEQISLPAGASAYEELVSELASGALKAVLPFYPIYTLKPLALGEVKNVRIEEGELLIELETRNP